MEVRPGYKQSEVGVIPEEWEVKTLGEIGDVRMCKRVLKQQTRSHGDVPFYKIGTFGGVANAYISGSLFEEFRRRYSFPKKGDVLISAAGTIGRSVVFDGASAYFQDSNIVWIENDESKATNEYLWHRYQVTKWAVSHGGTVARLYNDSLRTKIYVPVPPLPEQRAIAAALSDVDALLGGLDRLIAKKSDLKQAAMQQLLTGQTRLPGFSGAWEVKTLGDIVEKIVGGGTPSRANAAFWGNEIPWVTVKDFATFNPWHSQESITRLGLRNSASNLIPAGTLITSTRMALGKAVVYEVDVAINQDLKALFLKPEASVVLLTYWFEHFGNLIDELGSGSTVKGISIGELRRFPFQAPPLPEQTAIAAVLSDMDAELAALEARRDKTRDLKQAMMQELLTGKTRLL